MVNKIIAVNKTNKNGYIIVLRPCLNFLINKIEKYLSSAHHYI